jgi:hypothetical protein
MAAGGVYPGSLGGDIQGSLLRKTAWLWSAWRSVNITLLRLATTQRCEGFVSQARLGDHAERHR